MSGRRATTSGLAVFALTLMGVACGPMGPIPGGELSGAEAAPPDDWAFSDATETVQLETRPADPYSINVWGVGLGPHFYLAAGEGQASTWARHLVADPEVRLGVEGRLYPLRATRVEDPAEIERVLAAMQEKYDFVPDPEQRAQAWLFRLDPR
ncbi:MAG: hypothetical protein ACQGVK_16235 [Myxococcota bacterium]